MRESWLPCLVFFLVSRDCWVAIPLDTMGLSAVCDCDDTHLLFWESFMRTAMALVSLHICLV